MGSTAEQRKTRAQEGGPKKDSGGNSRSDQAWVEEMSAAGELHAPNEATRPEGFLYDVIYQWDGLSEEVNPDFFEFYRPANTKQEQRKCVAPAYIRDHRGGYVVDSDWVRIRRQCLARPAVGTNVCHSHGANIPAVKAAAAQRLAEASEIVALRLIGLTDVADEMGTPVEHKNRIAASNSVLDRAGVKGSVEVEITTPGYQKVMEKMFGDDSDGE